MSPYLKVDEWLVSEDGFNTQHNRSSESIFSRGNGKMGQHTVATLCKGIILPVYIILIKHV